MEEWVGKLWHRTITGGANRRFPEHEVVLEDMRRSAGVLFRALGGDPGLRLESASPTAHGARRSLLERIAGSNRKIELAWRDDQALYLPAKLDVLPAAALNRDLYLWLAALAAQPGGDGDWFGYNQWLTHRVLNRYPGLEPRYRKLVAASIALRPEPAALPADEAAQEQAIRDALNQPGRVAALPPATRPPQPVHVWLHPDPPRPLPSVSTNSDDPDHAARDGRAHQPQDRRRRRAEQVEMPEGDRGIVLDRFENIFGWAEYVKVDRSTDEEEDPEAAEQAASDLDVMSIARDDKSAASRVRFDLDLPAASSDDLPLGDGILLPEWDHRRGRMQPAHCRVQPMLARDAQPCELPESLRTTARRLRSQFEALLPERIWHRAQPDGSELDLDAYLHHRVERTHGRAAAEQGMFRDFRGGARDLSCLLLADLSLSTDAWVSDEARVIDVIRDSLFLFSEALSASGDRFALYGFSSRRREHVRIHAIKAFQERYNNVVRGRINAVRPGFYTRMGAALRYAGGLLAGQPARQQLLLLLTDGKPNDLDHYEGRYGVEDTRMALREARRNGLQPFCVTIDEKAGDYLPHLFGSDGYVVIRNPAELPRELPLLYARLTAA